MTSNNNVINEQLITDKGSCQLLKIKKIEPLSALADRDFKARFFYI